MEITDIDSAAKVLSMRREEIAGVDLNASEYGPVVRMADGSSYIDIAEETPDFLGRTGLAYFEPPCKGYNGVFPVLAHEPVIRAESADDAGDAGETSSAPQDAGDSGKGDEAGDGASSADSGSPVPVKGQD